jgi:hypothetical protein
MKFPNIIFETLILMKTRKAAKIWEGYDNLINEISAFC